MALQVTFQFTIKSNPDGRKFKTIKVVGTRAINITAYIDPASSFGLKFRMRQLSVVLLHALRSFHQGTVQ